MARYALRILSRRRVCGAFSSHGREQRDDRDDCQREHERSRVVPTMFVYGSGAFSRLNSAAGPISASFGSYTTHTLWFDPWSRWMSTTSTFMAAATVSLRPMFQYVSDSTAFAVSSRHRWSCSHSTVFRPSVAVSTSSRNRSKGTPMRPCCSRPPFGLLSVVPSIFFALLLVFSFSRPFAPP